MAAAVANLVNQAAESAGVVLGVGQTVLISGVTGFVGTHVALEYLKRGFRVHATARSQEKADAWNKLHPFAAANLKWFIVEDVATPGAFDEAIQGVDIVAHTASPFHMNAEDPEKDMLTPAIDGTMNMLKSAIKVSSIKRVVITSSFASVMDFDKLSQETTFTDSDWNPATREEAIKKAKENPSYLYCASKKLAEKAAWDFVEKEKPTWSLSTVCPPMIVGPPEQDVKDLNALNTSTQAVWAIIDPKEKKVPDTSFPVMTDVRDIARIHVLASTMDIAKGQRYLTIAHHFTNGQIAESLRKAFPEKADRISAPEGSTENDPHFKTDSSKVQKELGITWTTFDKTVVDTANKMFEIEARLAKQ